MQEKSTTLEYISYALAAIALVIGVVSVFELEFVSDHHDKALLWFAFALLAVLIPYIREITFKDLKVVIEKIHSASNQLDNAAISVVELNNRLNATRNELIDGYQELLHTLPERERKDRVIKLSKLYHQEMGTSVSAVKKWLIELGHPISHVDENMDDEYLDTLSRFQQANGLGDDGIFGYRTLNLILQLRSDTAKGSELR